VALVSDLVGAFDGRQASLAGETVADGLSATGDDSQAQGLALTATHNNITTADERNTTVVLPKIVSFKSSYCVIRNTTNEILNVYPFLGESINGLAANAKATVGSGAILVFYKVSKTKWVK